MMSDKVSFEDLYFHTSFVYDPRRDLVWKEVCKFLQRKYIPEGSRILDAGAGYCNFINNIYAKDKHAVDIYSKLSRYANDDVEAHILSCTELDCFDDDFFDIVFASNLLEHLTREDLLQTLNEFWRVLRCGGKIILLQPNFKYCYKTYFDDYTHLQVMTDRSIAELLETYGFTVIKVHRRFLPVNSKSSLRLNLPRLDLIVRLYLRLPFKPLAAQMLVVAEKRKRYDQE